MNFICYVYAGLWGFFLSFMLENIIEQLPATLICEKSDAKKCQNFNFSIIIKICSALLPMICLYHFGLTWQTVLASFLSLSLLVLIIIDIKHQILPDQLTLPLLWLGLNVNIFHLFTNINNAILGATMGYLSLWCIAKLFKHWRQVEGMGYGDFKMLALLGAWLGASKLVYIVLISSILGSLTAVLLIIFGNHTKKTPIAFGPYLAIGGWMMLFCTRTF